MITSLWTKSCTETVLKTSMSRLYSAEFAQASIESNRPVGRLLERPPFVGRGRIELKETLAIRAHRPGTRSDRAL
jgi:hypothetical protein